MIDYSRLNDPNLHPTLSVIFDYLDNDKISEFIIEKAEEPCVNFIYKEQKFTIELFSKVSFGETVSLSVVLDSTKESIGFFHLSMFNFDEQIALIVYTIMNYD